MLQVVILLLLNMIKSKQTKEETVNGRFSRGRRKPADFETACTGVREALDDLNAQTARLLAVIVALGTTSDDAVLRKAIAEHHAALLQHVEKIWADLIPLMRDARSESQEQQDSVAKMISRLLSNGEMVLQISKRGAFLAYSFALSDRTLAKTRVGTGIVEFPIDCLKKESNSSHPEPDVIREEHDRPFGKELHQLESTLSAISSASDINFWDIKPDAQLEDGSNGHLAAEDESVTDLIEVGQRSICARRRKLLIIVGTLVAVIVVTAVCLAVGITMAAKE